MVRVDQLRLYSNVIISNSGLPFARTFAYAMQLCTKCCMRSNDNNTNQLSITLNILLF